MVGFWKKVMSRRALAGMFAVYLFLFLMDLDCFAACVDKYSSPESGLANIENTCINPAETTGAGVHWISDSGGETLAAAKGFFIDPDCTKPALLKSKTELCGRLSVVLVQPVIYLSRKPGISDVFTPGSDGLGSPAADSIRTVVLLN